ncbi:MAG: hypothetical protein GY929_11685 [Actinomycetia bacterium]|nr:hypothetical protein [Actinomycetes bacterium]
MTSRLRPGVIIAAVLALGAGVIGLRSLASSESDTVPPGQPFVVEADYPTAVEEAPLELEWIRPPAPRNPFVADRSSPLAVAGEDDAGSLIMLPDETEGIEATGLGADDSSTSSGSSPGDATSPQSDAPLSNAAPAPDPGVITEIDIGSDDPNGLGG